MYARKLLFSRSGNYGRLDGGNVKDAEARLSTRNWITKHELVWAEVQADYWMNPTGNCSAAIATKPKMVE